MPIQETQVATLVVAIGGKFHPLVVIAVRADKWVPNRESAVVNSVLVLVDENEQFGQRAFWKGAEPVSIKVAWGIFLTKSIFMFRPCRQFRTDPTAHRVGARARQAALASHRGFVRWAAIDLSLANV